jgi:predicted KAP-like P-loop ATPase
MSTPSLILSSMSSKDQPTKTTGDEPISEPGQDVLGRADFASEIRREIEHAPRKDGLVIAVTGPWGSGKTSVLNLAVGPLCDPAGYRVVPFNPWLFSGTPQLVEHFFSELQRQLDGSGDAALDRIAAALEDYAEVIDPLRFLPGVQKASAWTRFVARVLKRPEQSAEEQRRHLAALLADRDELLVVVIDDIDRLRDEEIADVMRLVRLVAGFPNVVYLLAYDADHVADALHASAGHEYLEKIVQVTHEIPAIVGEQLSDLALERINGLVGPVPEERFDREHWSKLYLSFRKYLELPRDVVRFVNHARAPVAQLIDEVDVADILALEALRLFEREFWNELPALRATLTNTREKDAWLFMDGPKPDEDRLQSALKRANDPDTLRDIVVELFPAAARYIRNTYFGSDFLASWERARRVAHPAVLGTYLARQIQPTSVATATVQRALEALDDREYLERLIVELSDQQLPDLLSRLEAFEGDYPDDVAPAIPVLYEMTPRIPEDHSFFGVRPAMRVTRVILRLLRNRDSETITSTVERVLPSLNLSDRLSLIHLVGHQQGVGHELVDATNASVWENRLTAEILAATPQALGAEPALGLLVHHLEQHDPDAAVAKVREATESDSAFLLALIRDVRREVRNSAGRHVSLLWDRLVDLVGEDALIRLITALPELDETADADTVELVSQARIFAADPEAAKRVMAEHRARYS